MENINQVFPGIKKNELSSNLIDNGNFINGYTNWHSTAPDKVKYELVNSIYGKAIRISRSNGAGHWTLQYNGREIYYYKGVTYRLKFKYRVVKGEKKPFNVGWNVIDNGKNLYNLRNNTKILKDGWNELELTYQFIEDHKNIKGFINSQLANTIVEFADFELTNDDNLNSVHFVDELNDIRILIWKTAIDIWKIKPIFGYGIGDSERSLVEEYKLRNNREAYLKKYNCHNQFLETITQTGITGLILLLLVFVIPIYQAIKKKQELLLLFLMICFINFLFETMLHRLAGVTFFSFWYSFLWLVYYKEDVP